MTITCGETTRRKRELSDVTVVEFNFVIDWDMDVLTNITNITIDDAIYYIDEVLLELQDAMIAFLEEGKLNIEGYTLQENSFQNTSDVNDLCAPGVIKSGKLCSEYTFAYIVHEKYRVFGYKKLNLFQIHWNTSKNQFSMS